MGHGAASSPPCCPRTMDVPCHKDARGFPLASGPLQAVPWPRGHRRASPRVLTPLGPRPQTGLGAPGAFSFIYRPIDGSGAVTGLIFAPQQSSGYFSEISR